MTYFTLLASTATTLNPSDKGKAYMQANRHLTNTSHTVTVRTLSSKDPQPQNQSEQPKQSEQEQLHVALAMPPRKPAPTKETPPSPPSPPLATPALESTALRMSYRIARGEQGVLTFEPYKSLLLPLWRFKTVAIARASLAALTAAFTSYVTRGDFVGADMARKFIQMGMTRARRYANHKGGRKYDRSEREVERDGGKMSERRELEKSKGHVGMEEKAAASEVFKKGWEECRADEGYQALMREFQKEQKEWDKARKGVKVEIDGKTGQVKKEVKDEVEVKEESDQG